MIFDFYVLTPKNTPAYSPVLTNAPIVLGTITNFAAFMPPGSNGLAHLKVLLGLYQLFPSSEQGDFSASGFMYEVAEEYVVDVSPAELTLVTWNEDTTYDRGITVRLVIQPASGTPSASATIAALM